MLNIDHPILDGLEQSYDHFALYSDKINQIHNFGNANHNVTYEKFIKDFDKKENERKKSGQGLPLSQKKKSSS